LKNDSGRPALPRLPGHRKEVLADNAVQRAIELAADREQMAIVEPDARAAVAEQTDLLQQATPVASITVQGKPATFTAAAI
jgi:hypothetical protein